MDKRHNKTRRALTVALLAATLVSGTAYACYYCYTGTIVVKKFYDKNGNGVKNTGEPYIAGWPMTLGSASLGAIETKNTNASGFASFPNLAAGNDYTMTEGTPIETNWHQSAPRVNGIVVNPLTGIHVTAGYTKVVKFGNYCKKPSGGKTPGFWSNQNGQAKMLDGSPPSLLPELALLTSLNLVDADGDAFDPVDYASFRTWLLDSEATNMAYKLSSHVAAMALNIEAGFVNGSSFYAPFGGTINQLMTAANTSLGNFPYTPTGHPQRSAQEQLKNALDALNNGALVIPPSPCRRTFEPY
jgi:hypothetical protein